MTKSNFEKVGDFHAKFDLPHTEYGLPAALISTEAFEFRYKFMLEELLEMRISFAEGNLAEVADAIVDLLYVAYGTAHMMRLPIDELFDLVHEKNMQKQRAKPDGSDSVRKSSLDVVKPPGWTPPDVEGWLEKYNEHCRRLHEGLAFQW